MGKTISCKILLLALLLTPAPGLAANISWDLPTSYADGTPIDPHDAEKIVVKVYAGPSKTGPWRWVATSMPGATSVRVKDPKPGHILWYTVKSSLHGAESDHAAPVRKINLAFPVVPLIKKTVKWMFTVKKMALLSFLLLLIVAAGVIRHRKTRSRG